MPLPPLSRFLLLLLIHHHLCFLFKVFAFINNLPYTYTKELSGYLHWIFLSFCWLYLLTRARLIICCWLGDTLEEISKKINNEVALNVENETLPLHVFALFTAFFLLFYWIYSLLVEFSSSSTSTSSSSCELYHNFLIHLNIFYYITFFTFSNELQLNYTIFFDCIFCIFNWNSN